VEGRQAFTPQAGRVRPHAADPPLDQRPAEIEFFLAHARHGTPAAKLI